MSTIRRVNHTPNYQILEDPAPLARIFKEINRMQPKAELSIEGRSEVISARLMEWDSKRRLLVVKFHGPDAFHAHLESQSGLRAFFKTKLFSTQILFKTHAIRPSLEGAHFQVPEIVYEQQRRGALRVPLTLNPEFAGSSVKEQELLAQKLSVELITPIGVCRCLDLSVTGALILGSSRLAPGVIYEGVKFMIPSLSQVSASLLQIPFSFKVTHRTRVSPTSKDYRVGVQFMELSKKQKAILKQFLTDALHLYFKGKVSV